MTDTFTGNLLVASSLVTDPIFAGGVCLVVHQDDFNVIGVMLNRPMKPSPETWAAIVQQPQQHKNRLASQFAESSEESAEESAEEGAEGTAPSESSPLGSLHFGGPLSGPVVAIHQFDQYAEAETGSGIYVAAQKQHLENLIRRSPGPYRLIIGHLGWEVEQLYGEIDAGLWHLVPATTDTVFGTTSEMWPRLIRRATSSSLARWIGVPDVVGAGELN
jgi:putative transcriptional regulator